MERAHGPEPCSPVSECAEMHHGVIPLDTLLKRALGLDQEDTSSSTSTSSVSSPPWKKTRFEEPSPSLSSRVGSRCEQSVHVDPGSLDEQSLQVDPSSLDKSFLEPMRSVATESESAGQRVSASSSWSSQFPELSNQDDLGDESWNYDQDPDWDVWCNSFDSDWPCSWESWDMWWPSSNRQLDRMRRGHSRRRAGQFVDFYNRKFGVVKKHVSCNNVVSLPLLAIFLACARCQVLCWQAALHCRSFGNSGDDVQLVTNQ